MANWGKPAAQDMAWGTEPHPDDAWSGSVATNKIATALEQPRESEVAWTGAAKENKDSAAQDNGVSTFGDAAGSAGDDAQGDREAGKCFSCGDSGHRAAECPTPREMTCRFCHQPGHMVKDCPDKPPMVCDNCGQEGHMQKNCENARKINRDHVKDVSPEVAWENIINAVNERDYDDVRMAIQQYVKALGGEVTYRELQESFFASNISLFLIPLERDIMKFFTNMDLQGNMGLKYTISYRFSEHPSRPREKPAFPKNREEHLARLTDAGDVVNSGRPLCGNCGELGHTRKYCEKEVRAKPDQPKISCSNCGQDGHRLRDCSEPRVDKFACRNCGKSGHKASECEEPPNLDNVECRNCNEKGHFSRDCSSAGPRGCRNCGEEGHMAKDCDQPRNMSNVTCRNCEKMGHMSRDCPEPKDWSKVQCSNCQQFGHTKVRCKEPPADAGEFDGGNAAGDSSGAAAGGNADSSWPTEDHGASAQNGGSTNDDGGW
ncbi:hypothetical protein HIM_06796 [Hirsutella minnesotensis 3608]|uniref:CCHC-type domain-containing protein n=1 Tax=Hirsutella minnesotensis 3608 TaxID=1043627 RepID=A0A0F7ZTY1_9HYPO|nr:hypothetical protein HIM_06796 [Hirsutella minnesotensis 3608]